MERIDFGLPDIVWRATEEAGGLAKAARTSGIPKGTLSRLIEGQPKPGPGPMWPVKDRTFKRLVRWLPQHRVEIDFFTQPTGGHEEMVQYNAWLLGQRRQRLTGGVRRLGEVFDPRWSVANQLYRALRLEPDTASDLAPLEAELRTRGLSPAGRVGGGLRSLAPRGELAILRVLEPLVDGDLSEGMEPDVAQLAGDRDRTGGRPLPRLRRVLRLGVDRELVLLRSWRAPAVAQSRAAVARHRKASLAALEQVLLEGPKGRNVGASR